MFCKTWVISSNGFSKRNCTHSNLPIFMEIRMLSQCSRAGSLMAGRRGRQTSKNVTWLRCPAGEQCTASLGKMEAITERRVSVSVPLPSTTIPVDGIVYNQDILRGHGKDVACGAVLVGALPILRRCLMFAAKRLGQ